MKLLLDTHALLWWLADDRKLGPAARAAIADPANTVLVSIVSLWEIAVKVRIGKLEADVAAISAELPRARIGVLAIALPHLSALMRVAAHHRDPFDHLIVAQAMAEECVLMSDDGRMDRYGARTMQAGV